MGIHRTWESLVSVVFALTFVAGCSLHVPTDPDGTLDRVEGGVLRAGASPQDNLVEESDDGSVTGSEAELVEQFAESIDARVEWTIGGEESLVKALESGDLDLVVGGLTEKTPWANKVGVTRGYPTIDGAAGRKLVVLVPPGENRFLFELESFLDDEVG